MRLYLDSADTYEWQRLARYGLFYGVTTNPLLMEQAGRGYDKNALKDFFDEAQQCGFREVHIQIKQRFLLNIDRVIDEIKDLGETYKVQGVIKVPLDPEFIEKAVLIKKRGLPILMTACFEPKQMVVAQAIGAEYAAPYYGRGLDAGRDARQDLKQMRFVGQTAQTPCRLLIASIRSIDDMIDLVSDGHDCFTIRPDIARTMLDSDLTRAAVEMFEQAGKE